MWVNEQKTCLLSAKLKEHINAEVGKSTVTITYIDSITTAELNVLYVLEVLPTYLYQQYVTLGIFTPPDPTSITCSGVTSSQSSQSDQS